MLAQLKASSKGMLYPSVLFIFIGSFALNVSRERRERERLETAYDLQIPKLKQVLEQLQRGTISNVDEELKLVNRKCEALGVSGTYFQEMPQKNAEDSSADLKELSGFL